MDNILNEVFVKGVLPACIVGILGYFISKFLLMPGHAKWKLTGTLIIFIIAGLVVAKLYIFISEPFNRTYVPEDTHIIGANSKTDFGESYWDIDSNITVALPLYVKFGRNISLSMKFKKVPFEMEYRTGTVRNTIAITDYNALIFQNINVDLLSSSNTKLSEPINQDEERVYSFKFRISKQNQILSYQVGRSFPLSKVIEFMIIEVLLICFVVFILIRFIYLKPRKTSGVQTNGA